MERLERYIFKKIIKNIAHLLFTIPSPADIDTHGFWYVLYRELGLRFLLYSIIGISGFLMVHAIAPLSLSLIQAVQYGFIFSGSFVGARLSHKNFIEFDDNARITLGLLAVFIGSAFGFSSLLLLVLPGWALTPLMRLILIGFFLPEQVLYYLSTEFICVYEDPKQGTALVHLLDKILAGIIVGCMLAPLGGFAFHVGALYGFLAVVNMSIAYEILKLNHRFVQILPDNALNTTSRFNTSQTLEAYIQDVLTRYNINNQNIMSKFLKYLLIFPMLIEQLLEKSPGQSYVRWFRLPLGDLYGSVFIALSFHWVFLANPVFLAALAGIALSVAWSNNIVELFVPYKPTPFSPVKSKENKKNNRASVIPEHLLQGILKQNSQHALGETLNNSARSPLSRTASYASMSAPSTPSSTPLFRKFSLPKTFSVKAEKSEKKQKKDDEKKSWSFIRFHW